MFPKTIQLFRDSYSNHPKEIWALATLTFINRLGTMVLPFLTVYLTTVLDFSFKDAGMLAGMFGVGSLLGSFLGGKLTDKFGANFIIANSLIAGGVLLIFVQWVTSFYGLAVMIFLTAVSGDSYRPALMSSVRNFVPKSETGRSIALIRLAINLGFSAAPVIGGVVAISLGYDWLFWIDGITCIAAAIYFLFASRKWVVRIVSEEEKQKTLSEVVVAPYKNMLFLALLFSNFILGFAFIQWFQSVPVFMKTEWGFDEHFFGMVIGTNGLLICLLEMPLIHKIERAGKSKSSILWGISLIGLSFIPFLFFPSLLWCFLAVILFTLGEILYLPLINSIILNMSPEKKRGEYMAWYSMMWSLTHITGPTIGLAFIGAMGFSPFFIGILLLTFLSLLFNMRLLQKV